ncbi:MAG: DNA replication/repair protein RecF [Bacilli bacterium]|nr:DNA replication/repair protein RecF [Bacilli bacterium]
MERGKIMILKNLKIRSFRNYSKLDLELDDNINIIYGNNGQGKTNILESIYVLALTKSHRSYIDENLIKNGEEAALIKGKLEKDITYDLEIKLNKTSKKVKIDNKLQPNYSDYIDKMNVIIFSSEDLDLIKGSPSERRKYINVELSQLSKNYYSAINDYNKLLKIRNEYLKKMANNEQVDLGYFNILTDYLINKCVFIYQMREKYIKRLNNLCPNIFNEIANIKNFNIKYKPSIEFEDYSKENIRATLEQKYKESLEKEKLAKTTLYGPHRDDFEFCVSEDNLRTFGSQGQQKMAVIALKLSEIELFKDYKKTSPIILLDDVFSDLDSIKKNNLLKHINNKMQVIITTTDLENIDKKLIKKAKLIHIKSGKVIQNEVIK